MSHTRIRPSVRSKTRKLRGLAPSVDGLESRLLLAIDFSSLRGIGGTGALFASGIAIDSAGNSYVTGVYSGKTSLDGSNAGAATGTTDVFVAKFASSGAQLWFRHFGNAGTGSSGGQGIAVDSTGNVYVTGFFSGKLDFDPLRPNTHTVQALNRTEAFVVKFDTNGNYGASSYLLATTGVAGRVNQGLAIATDPAGNAVVGGTFQTSIGFDGGTLAAVAAKETWVAKLSPTGGLTYLKSFTGTAGSPGSEARGVAIDPSGNAYIAGTFAGSTAFGPSNILPSTPSPTGGVASDSYVVKLGTTGTVTYAKGFGSALNDEAAAVAADSSGNAVVVGKFVGSISVAPFNLSSTRPVALYVARVSPTGTVLFANALDVANDAASGDKPGVVVNSAGAAFVTASFQGSGSIGGVPVQSAGSNDIFIAKIGTGGGVESVKTGGGSGADAVTGIGINGAGQLALIGPSTPPATYGAGVLSSAGASNLFVAQALDIVVAPPPSGTTRKPAGDFDGDGKTDLAVFDPSTATFFLQQTTGPLLSQQFGIPNGQGLPVGGDFDGDGKTDSAFFDPTSATYYIRYSNPAFNGGSRVQQFGIPNGRGFMNPGDFDGDGKTDEAVFDPVEAKYYIRYSNPAFNGGSRIQQFGVPNGQGIMIPGDFDGDGKSDEAVFDPVEAKYYIRYSNPAFNGGSRIQQFGIPNGVNQFVAGDFDGDGKTDETVFDPVEAKYYIRYSNPLFNGGSRVQQFGVPNGKGVMVPGDFDGDGKTDEAVFDPSSATFYIRYSGGGSLIKQFGPVTGRTLPIPAVVRPGTVSAASFASGDGSDFVALADSDTTPPLPKKTSKPQAGKRFGSGN